MLFDSPIVFVRLTDKGAAKLLKRAGPRWWAFDRDPADIQP
jgi:hypothetical protein